LPLYLPYSTLNGVDVLIRMVIFGASSGPGSLISEPNARIPIIFFE
jgi:hypothetical protein